MDYTETQLVHRTYDDPKFQPVTPRDRNIGHASKRWIC
jgi:hypothetical protein